MFNIFFKLFELKLNYACSDLVSFIKYTFINFDNNDYFMDKYNNVLSAFNKTWLTISHLTNICIYANAKTYMYCI